jgi:multiple sugar transport system substrate-binding protein
MQMRKRQKTVLALALATSVVALAGCSGNSGGGGSDASFSKDVKGNLTVWGFNNADDVGKALLNNAKENVKGVTIKLDQTTFDAQKFTTRVASGNVPDVVQMDRSFVATYAAQGLIKPLDKCYSTWDVTPSDRYYSSVVNDITYKDNVWAVPAFFQPPAIILNTRVMGQAGVTAADIDTSKPDTLLAAATKMYQANGGKPTRLGFDSVPTGYPELWLLSYGGRLVDDKGAPALDDPNNAKALEFLKKLADAQGGYAKMKSFSDTFDTFGDNNQYVKDQVGAQVNAQWYVNVLTPYVDQVQISAVPFKDQKGNVIAAASGNAFVIPAGAKNPDAACKYMLNLTSQDAWMAAGAARAKTISKTPGAINTGLFTGSPKADKAIREKYVKPSGNKGFDETIDTYYKVVSEGTSFGASPAGQTIKTELQNAITSTLLGNKSAKAALSEAQDASMRAYDKVVKK